LAAVVARANQEGHRAETQLREAGRDQRLSWLKAQGVAAELEPPERALLKKPFGSVDEKITATAAWRGEGLAVLAWALKRFTLPAYDVAVFPPDPVLESIGFGNQAVARELLDSGALRPSPELDRFASHATVVSWRLRQFTIQPGPMDLVAFLRAFGSFKEAWLDDLRIVDGDLAIGTHSIFRASAEEVQRCRCIAVERQIAAYWLQGDDPVYSKVDPVTLLSAC
jgi:hypothetical protein